MLLEGSFMSPSLFRRVMKLEPVTRHDLLEFVGGSEMSEDDIVRIVSELEETDASKPEQSTHLQS